LDPRLARAHEARALLHIGRYDYAAALAEARVVIADEPENAFAWDIVCWMLTYIEPPRLDEAVDAGKRALQLDPDFHMAHFHLARALAIAGRTDEAQRAIASTEERLPQSIYVALAHFWIELSAHRPREALAVLTAVAQREGNRKYTAIEGSWVAIALGQLGELDKALVQLDEALAAAFRDVPSLRSSVWFEPLRRDPRFGAVLSKHGLSL
jgi:tetratricopeptide (TPR) repeat protein